MVEREEAEIRRGNNCLGTGGMLKGCQKEQKETITSLYTPYNSITQPRSDFFSNEFNCFQLPK